MRGHSVYNQRFNLRSASVAFRCTDQCLCVDCTGLSGAAMNELMGELLYDGYADSGEVSEGSILLYGADPWMCGEENLKEMIRSKMESMNYEVRFLP